MQENEKLFLEILGGLTILRYALFDLDEIISQVKRIISKIRKSKKK